MLVVVVFFFLLYFINNNPRHRRNERKCALYSFCCAIFIFHFELFGRLGNFFSIHNVLFFFLSAGFIKITFGLVFDFIPQVNLKLSKPQKLFNLKRKVLVNCKKIIKNFNFFLFIKNPVGQNIFNKFVFTAHNYRFLLIKNRK